MSNSPSSQHVAELYGKKIYISDPKIECEESDVKNFLSIFRRIDLLRSISNCSSKMVHDPFLELGDFLLSIDSLLFTTIKIITYSTDEIGKRAPNNEEFILLLRMCTRLLDKEIAMKYVHNEIMMHMGYAQFFYQQRHLNLTSRVYYMYEILWPQVEKAKDLNIQDAIEKVIDVPFQALFIFSLALTGNKNGYFFEPYNEEQLKDINERFNLSLTPNDHKRFIDWCSGTYEEILNEDNLLNPFFRYPIVKTNTKPKDDLKEVYIIVSHQLLIHKITTSLYFTLADIFKGEKKKNPFKERFGFVFQEYVGCLLKYYFNTWEIVPEISYRFKKQSNDTVDWFILKDERLVMVEVKQSSVYQKAKKFPKMDALENDLKNNIQKAVTQLTKTESDIKLGTIAELQIFQKVKHFIKVIVINDFLPNANSILKKLLNNKNPQTSSDFHIFNIEDFEFMLQAQKGSESLFDVLSYKELDDSEMDFHEFIPKQFPENKENVEFLVKYYNEIAGRDNASEFEDSP